MDFLKKNLKNGLYILMLVITLVASVVYYRDGFSLTSNASTSIGDSAGGGQMLRFSSGDPGNIVAEEFPSLMVTLGPVGSSGYNINLQNDLQNFLSYYKDYQASLYDTASAITIMNDKTARSLSAAEYNKLELAWYAPGEDALRTTGTRSSDWKNSVMCKFNGAPSTSSPPAFFNTGVYFTELQGLSKSSSLSNWESLITADKVAQSKQLWGYFGELTGNTSSYQFHFTERYNKYCVDTAGYDLNNYTAWDDNQATQATLKHIDVLMTLYSMVKDTVPGCAAEYKTAIDRYIKDGTTPGVVSETCNIVVVPTVLFKLNNEGRVLITSINDVFNYVETIGEENYLSRSNFKSKLDALNIHVDDLYERNYQNAVSNAERVLAAGGSYKQHYFDGGFSYVPNYAWKYAPIYKSKTNTWANRHNISSMGMSESLSVGGYKGFNIVVAPPKADSPQEFDATFKVLWARANSRYNACGLEQETVNDTVHFMINMKVPDSERASWNTLLSKYDHYELGFKIKSNATTGKTSSTNVAGETPSAMIGTDYRVNGTAYPSGELADLRVQVTPSDIKRYIMGDTCYVALYDFGPREQTIKAGEIQNWGYDLQVYVVCGTGSNSVTKTSSETGWSHDTSDADKFSHSVMAMRTDENTMKYYSSPEAFAEFKQGTVQRDGNGADETYEAMAGVPTTETMYFASGGSEFIVELELQLVKKETAARRYYDVWFGTECEFKRNDQWISTESMSDFSDGPAFSSYLSSNKSNADGSKKYTQETYYTSKSNFVGDEIGEDHLYEGVTSQWVVMFTPDGADSFTNNLNGHNASAPFAQAYEKDSYSGSSSGSTEGSSSTTIRASWSGTIQNEDGNKGNAEVYARVNYKEANTAPHGGYDGNAGEFNTSACTSATNWNITEFVEELKKAESWALDYEATNANKFGTASKLSDSNNATDGDELKNGGTATTATEPGSGDPGIKTWKIGNATINVSVTGGRSNQNAGNYTTGSYTTGTLPGFYNTVKGNGAAGANYFGLSTSYSHGTDGTAGTHADGPGSPPEPCGGDKEGTPTKASTCTAVGNLHYTITVTFSNGTIGAHELCGPCHVHNLPMITDCWYQKATYDYTKINACRVYKIHRGWVEDMDEITLVDYNDSEDLARSDFNLHWMHGSYNSGGTTRGRQGDLSSAQIAKKHNGTDTIVSAISQGDPNIFYNIGNMQPLYKATSGGVAQFANGPSMAGRIRYSFQAQQHDWVYMEEMSRRGNIGWADGYSCVTGTRSNKCDGLCDSSKESRRGHNVPWANGILYSRNMVGSASAAPASYFDEYWMATDWNDDGNFPEYDYRETGAQWNGDEWGTAERNGHGQKKSNYSDSYLDDKDILTEEYHRFRFRRNMKNTATIISDMLILQTSAGDQSVMYCVQGSQTKKCQQHYDYDKDSLTVHSKGDGKPGHVVPLSYGGDRWGFTPDLMESGIKGEWFDNPHSAYNWGDNNIGQYGDVNVGSYTGEYQTPYDKYSTTDNNVRFGTFLDGAGGISYTEWDRNATASHPLNYVDHYYGDTMDDGSDCTFKDNKDNYGANKVNYAKEIGPKVSYAQKKKGYNTSIYDKAYGNGHTQAAYIGRQLGGYDVYTSSVVPGAEPFLTVPNVIDEVDAGMYKSTPNFCIVKPNKSQNAFSGYQCQVRMGRVSGLRIFTDEIWQNPTNPNQEYMPGNAYQSYIMIMDWDTTGGAFPHQYPAEPVYIQDLDDKKTVDGYILDAPYSREHDKINDFVVQNPISVENAVIQHSDPSHDSWDGDGYTWEVDFSKDSRVDNELLGATNLKKELNKVQTCPRNPELCDFRILDCSFGADEIVAFFDFETASGNTYNKVVNTAKNKTYTLPAGFEVNYIGSEPLLGGAAFPYRPATAGNELSKYRQPEGFNATSVSIEKWGVENGTQQNQIVLKNAKGQYWVPDDYGYSEFGDVYAYDTMAHPEHNQPLVGRSYRRMFNGVYGNYLSCQGTRWGIPLTDLVGGYSPSTRMTVEMDVYVPLPRLYSQNLGSKWSYTWDAWGKTSPMIIGFANYGFYIPDWSPYMEKYGTGQNRQAGWTTGNGLVNTVKNTNFVDQNMKLKFVIDFDNAKDSELYINGQKVTQWDSYKDYSALTSASFGDKLYIGSWSKDDSHPASFYIDNLKIIKNAGELSHDKSCYETITNHATTLQYSCQQVNEYPYDVANTGKPSLYVAPMAGKYRFEAFGGQGGGTSNAAVGSHGGLGGYSYGFLHMNKGDEYLVYPGGEGQAAKGTGTLYAWTLHPSACGNSTKWNNTYPEVINGYYRNSATGVVQGPLNLHVCWSETVPSGYSCSNHSVSVLEDANGVPLSKEPGGVNLVEDFNYTGGVQTWTAAKDGEYTIETWGAQGGNDSQVGGKGGYSKGTFTLKAGQKLYLAVGGAGASAASGNGGGWNGGGNAGSSGSSGGGGGASSVSTATTGGGTLREVLANSSTKNSVLLVAGGGGGAGNNQVDNVGTTYSFNATGAVNVDTYMGSFVGPADGQQTISFSASNGHMTYFRLYKGSTLVAQSTNAHNGTNNPTSCTMTATLQAGVTYDLKVYSTCGNFRGKSITATFTTKGGTVLVGAGGTGGGTTGGNGGSVYNSTFNSAGATSSSYYQLGQGGPCQAADGAGGGGGYYGAYGAKGDAGAGGGAGYIKSGATNTASSNGVREGNGLIRITHMQGGYPNTESAGWNGGGIGQGTSSCYGFGGGGAADIRKRNYGGVYTTGSGSDGAKMYNNSELTYGPYIKAAPGHYQADIYGTGLNACDFDVVSNTKLDQPYKIKEIKVNSTHATLYFDINDNLPASTTGGLEVRVHHKGVSGYTFKEVWISRLEDRVLVAGGGGGADNAGGTPGDGDDGSGGIGGGQIAGNAKVAGSETVLGVAILPALQNEINNIKRPNGTWNAMVGIHGSGCGIGGNQSYGYELGYGESASYVTDTGGAGGGYYGGFATNYCNGGGGGGSGYVSGALYNTRTIGGTNAGAGLCRITFEEHEASTNYATEDASSGLLKTFNYTGSVQEYTLPVTGNYKFAAWGASGGDGRVVNTDTVVANSGGAGGFASGSGYYTAGTKVYVYVGGKGGNAPASSLSYGVGGWNGGGDGGTELSGESYPENAAGGGGASDVRLSTNINDRIIIAGGGGGAGSHFNYAGSYGGAGGGIAGTSTNNYTFGGTQQKANSTQQGEVFKVVPSSSLGSWNTTGTVSGDTWQLATGKTVHIHTGYSGLPISKNGDVYYVTMTGTNVNKLVLRPTTKESVSTGSWHSSVNQVDVVDQSSSSSSHVWKVTSKTTDQCIAFCFDADTGPVTVTGFTITYPGRGSFDNYGKGQNGYSHSGGMNYGATGGGGGGYYGGTTTATPNSYAYGGAGGSGYTGSLKSANCYDGTYPFGGPNGGEETGHRGNGCVKIYLEKDTSSSEHTADCQLISSINNYHEHKLSCIDTQNVVLRNALSAEYNGNSTLLRMLLGNSLYNKLNSSGRTLTISGFTSTDYKGFYLNQASGTGVDKGLQVTNFGTNPHFINPDITMDAKSVDNIVLHMTYDYGYVAPTAQLYFITAADGTYNASKMIQATYDEGIKGFTFYCKDHTGWAGTIKGLSFDFVPDNTTSTSKVTINDIEINVSGAVTNNTNSTVVLNKLENFTDTKDGGYGLYSRNGNPMTFKNGIMKLSPNSKDGGYGSWDFTYPVNLTDASNLRFVRIKLLNKTACTIFGMGYFNGSINEYYFSVPMIANQKDSDPYQTIIIPINMNGAGARTYLDFDPVPGNPTERNDIYIKSIELIGYGDPAQGSSSTAALDQKVFNYTGSVQTYTIPKSGYYYLEAAGAQGGMYNQGHQGGYGGYTSGLKYFNKGEVLYVYVGGMGRSYPDNTSDSWTMFNGGGVGNSGGGNGGGATDFRTINGNWWAGDSLSSRILVAGGGGGSDHQSGGGAGGGLVGGNATLPRSGSKATGGTQTSGGIQPSNSASNGRFGYGGGKEFNSSIDAGGGGGGWYGGAAGTGGHCAGAGGSSYISPSANFSETQMFRGYNAGNGWAAITFADITSTTKDYVTTTVNGRKYARVLYQDISSNTNYFTAAEAASGYYYDSGNPNKFLAVYDLEKFRGSDGKFGLMMHYPDNPTYKNYWSEWRQSTNPWAEQRTNSAYSGKQGWNVDGFTNVNYLFYNSGYDYGMEFNGSSCVFDTSMWFGNWWGCIGIIGSSYTPTNGNDGNYTMPGPYTPGDSRGARKCELWVQVPDGVSATWTRRAFKNGTAYTPATTANGTHTYTVSYSNGFGLDGSEASITNAINRIKQYANEVPNTMGGEVNPIFTCKFIYNEHSCELTNGLCYDIEVLKCTEPHHYGMHYASVQEALAHGRDFCYLACNDDSKHVVNNDNPVDQHQRTVQQEVYINTDEYFDVFFPNHGDFYESDTYSIPNTTKVKGIGYQDETDTSEWMREKYVKFDFDSLFYREETQKWEQYLAGQWIELPVKGHSYPYYHFYCTLNNNEKSASLVQFEAEAINADDSNGKYNYKNWAVGTVFGANAPIGTLTNTNHGAEDLVFSNISKWGNNGETASNHANDNDNSREETNKNRFSSLRSWHGAHKIYYLDLVGRIGNMFIIDTGDLEFSNLFKVPVADGAWLIDGIVKEIYPNLQNFYLTWDYADGTVARDVRNRQVTMADNMYNVWWTQNWCGSNVKEPGNHLISATKNHALQMPIGSKQSNNNNVQQLLGNLLEIGYNIKFEITTIGDYQDMLRVKPYYYALCVKDDPELGHHQWDLIPVDVHMNTENGYKTINYFGAVDNTSTWNIYKDKVFSYDLFLNWNNEYLRRNYTNAEQTITQGLRDRILTYVEATDTMKKLEIPSGDYYSLGNAQILVAGPGARTFIGSRRTAYENKTFNGGDDTNFDDLFEDDMYGYRAQRWHLELGLPSSATFTFYENGVHLDPMEEVSYRGETVKAMNIISPDDEETKSNYCIVMTANLKAMGKIWNLAYMQNVDKDRNVADSNTSKRWTNGSIDLKTADGSFITRNFGYIGSGSDAEFRVVLGIYDPGMESNLPSDYDIIGTH